MKTCPNCNQTKDLSGFYKEKEGAGGYRKICKICRDKQCVEYRAKNRIKVNARYRTYNKKNYQKLRLMRYKLTPEQYNLMLSNQKNLCAICYKPPSGRYPLAVDHNHSTGKARELLCHRCNHSLAILEDPELLPKCIAYLEKHK